MSSTRSLSIESDSSLEIDPSRTATEISNSIIDSSRDDDSITFCQRSGTSKHSEPTHETESTTSSEVWRRKKAVEDDSDSSLSIRSAPLTDTGSSRVSPHARGRATFSSRRSHDSLDDLKNNSVSDKDGTENSPTHDTLKVKKVTSSMSGESDYSDTHLTTPGIRKSNNRKIKKLNKKTQPTVEYELSTDDGEAVGCTPTTERNKIIENSTTTSINGAFSKEVESDIPIITVTENGTVSSPFRLTPPEENINNVDSNTSMEWFRDSSNHINQSMVSPPPRNSKQLDYVSGRMRRNFTKKYRAYSAKDNGKYSNRQYQPSPQLRRAASAPPRPRRVKSSTPEKESSEQSSSVHTVPPSKGRMYNGNGDFRERVCFRNDKRYPPTSNSSLAWSPQPHKSVNGNGRNAPLVWEESSFNSIGYNNSDSHGTNNNITSFTTLLHSVTSITQANQLEHRLASKLLGGFDHQNSDKHVLQLEGLCANMLASNMREKHRRMTQLAHSISILEQANFIKLVGRYYLRLITVLQRGVEFPHRELSNDNSIRYKVLSIKGNMLEDEVVRLIATQLATIDAHCNTSRKNVIADEMVSRIYIRSLRTTIDMYYYRYNEILTDETVERRGLFKKSVFVQRHSNRDHTTNDAVRPYLGIEISNGISYAGNRFTETGALLTGTDGVVVVAVDLKGPSARCLRQSDIITHVNGEYIVDAQSFKRVVSLLTSDTWKRITVEFLRATEHSDDFTYFTECVGTIGATATTKPLQQKKATCQFGRKPNLWTARRSPTRGKSCPTHSRSPPAVRRPSPSRISPIAGRLSPGRINRSPVRVSRSPIRRNSVELRTPPSPWAVGSVLKSRSPSPRKLYTNSPGSLVEY